MQVWVIESDGVPDEALLNSNQGLGTRIAVDSNTDIGYYYKSGNGVTPLAGGGVDRWTYLIFNTDFTIVSSTPTVLTATAFTPIADSVYRVEGQLMLETDTANNGPCPGVDWPSGLTSGVIRFTTAEGTLTEALLNANDGANDRVEPATFPANTVLPADFSCTFLTGSSPSGDFALTISSLT